MDAGTGLEGDLVFPSTSFPGLLRVPSGTGTPSAISRTPAIERLATSAGDGAIWQVSNGATPRLDGYLGYLGGVWDTAVSAVLPAAPQRLAARGALAAVAHDSGLSLVDGASPPAGTAPFADIPGFASPTFLGLGFTPSGDVWLVVTDFALTEAQLWAPGSIVPGGTPSATVAVMNGAHSAAWLEDGLWIFGTDGGGIPQATLIGGAFTELRTIPTSDRLGEVHAVSPNSRLLVCREFGGTLGYPLRFFLADPETGFPEVGSLIFTERIEGFTFDTKGERLYVLTQNPDRVITVD